MSFNYYIPTKILFGRGKLNELGDQNLPGKKALIVTSNGTSVKKYGYLDRVKGQLEKVGATYLLFDKILPNPIKEHVMEGAALAKENGIDFIVGLGGGSSIDAAKAIAVTAVTTFVLSLYLGFGMMLKFPVAFLPTYQIREAVTSTAIFQPFPILIGIVWVVTLLILSWCSFRKCELK